MVVTDAWRWERSAAVRAGGAGVLAPPLRHALCSATTSTVARRARPVASRGGAGGALGEAVVRAAGAWRPARSPPALSWRNGPLATSGWRRAAPPQRGGEIGGDGPPRWSSSGNARSRRAVRTTPQASSATSGPTRAIHLGASTSSPQSPRQAHPDRFRRLSSCATSTVIPGSAPPHRYPSRRRTRNGGRRRLPGFFQSRSAPNG
jgi:hypothetical protein